MPDNCDRCGKPMGDSYYMYDEKTTMVLEVCHACRREIKYGKRDNNE